MDETGRIMTYEDFLNLLLPFKGILAGDGTVDRTASKGAFVRDLINNITEIELSMFSSDAISEDEDESNNRLTDDYLSRSDRAITANAIYIVDNGRLDTEKFKNYVECIVDENGHELICNPILDGYNLNLDIKNYGSVLADVFKNILECYADEKRIKAIKSKNTKNNNIVNESTPAKSNPHSYNELMDWLDKRGDDCQNAIKAMDELSKMENNVIYAWPDAKIYASYHYQFVLKVKSVLSATHNALSSNKVTALIVHDFENLMISAEKEHSNLDDTYASTPGEDFQGYHKYYATYSMMMDLLEHVYCFRYIDVLKMLADERK